MQSRQTLTVTVYRATKAQFGCVGKYSVPPMVSFMAGSAPAFAGNGNVVAWKAGVLIEADSANVNLYPGRTIALLKTILTKIQPQDEVARKGKPTAAGCGPSA